LNAKKTELAKLHNQLEHSLFEHGNKTRPRFYILCLHICIFIDTSTRSNKRRHHMDTSDEDEKVKITNIFNRRKKPVNHL